MPRTLPRRLAAAALAVAALAPTLVACGPSDALVIYSGRQKPLVGELLEKQLKDKLGFDVEVHYGQSAELAHQLAEEGDSTDADVFFSQDAGALGAIAAEGMLSKLPQSVLDQVPARFRAEDGTWVGTSARARVVAYDPKQVEPADLPKNIDDVVDPKWKGKVGYAPSNASWQSFVTGLRMLKGEDAAREWLEKFKANEPQKYANNIVIRDAVDRGEIALGLINHYYWYQKAREVGEDKLNVKLHFVGGDDPLALVNVAGAAILKTTDRAGEARKAIEFLLSEQGQLYFADHEAEYATVPGVKSTKHDLPPLEKIGGPELDLSKLASLAETEKLLREVGLV